MTWQAVSGTPYPLEQWDCVVDAAGHPKIDRSQLRWFRDYEWRPPQVGLTPVLATSSNTRCTGAVLAASSTAV